MSASASHTASGSGADWASAPTALGWTEGDRLGGFLGLPRLLAVTVVAADPGQVRHVVDVGSGPADFLAIALERFPQARGTWIDVSPAMEPLARARLGELARRVEFAVTGLDRLTEVAGGGTADVVLSARVTHHLDEAGLAGFYRQAATALRPGGWLANLDHVTLPGPWAGRLRHARAQLVPPNPSTHRHDYPLPTASQHADALTAAGFTDLDTPWRAFWSVLFLARKPGRASDNGYRDAPANPGPATDPSEEGQTR